MARSPRSDDQPSKATKRSEKQSSGAGAGSDGGPGASLPPIGDENALYVIDLSGYVFRAYHAIAPLSNSKGEPTHAVYGTTQMIKRLVDERKPAHVVVAMDSKAPSFRKELDPRYKANRPPPPPDLSQQMQRCEEIARAYGMPILQRDGVEADDLIASLARDLKARAPHVKIVVVSADKDLMQLVDDHLVMWDTMRNKVYGAAEVMEKFGVPPSQVRDLLALMGDSSDNVPGVPGVGPKTAADLLTQFGTIDALYARIDEVAKAKLKQSLIDNRGEAFLSRTLVTLKEDEEVPIDLAKPYGAPHGEAAIALRKLFTELEFARLVDSVEVAAPTQRSYRAITDEADLAAFVAEVRAAVAADPAARLALDTESTSLRTVDATLVGVSLAFRRGEAVYVPIGHRYLGAPAQIPLARVQAILGPLLADASVPKAGHNLKFDGEMLELAGMPVLGAEVDTILAHYLLDPEAPHGLKELAQSELGVQMTTYDQVTRKDAQKRGHQLAFDEVPIEDATPYAAADADLSRELAERLMPRVDAAGLGKLLREVEMPLSEILAAMELAGIELDVAALRKLGGEVDVLLREIEERAKALIASDPKVENGADAARNFNIASPKQIETLLFDVLELPVVKRTKTGRSTDADVLEELEDKHALPGVILEHRALFKLKGTYLDALPKLVSPRTGRIHTCYQQHVAATGRLSSTDPNLQNIPIRTELGRKIRGTFVAPAGHVLMSADYSQIELRVLADLSKDPILVDAFQRGEDIHTRTARELFLHDVDSTAEPSKELRRRAKAVNFGVVYGQGEAALAKSLDISREEAGGFIARYFERYAGVRTYMDEQIELARKGEGVRTLLGRRRFLPDIHSPNRALRMQAERIARNTPIQGTAADILKLAMVALRDPVVPGARMLLTVHDELVFEVPAERVEEASKIVRAKMEGVVSLAVPLLVEVGWGRTWADAHG
jgi:DNA polymerase-1